jgi:type IV pilus assembly protein PilA
MVGYSHSLTDIGLRSKSVPYSRIATYPIFCIMGAHKIVKETFSTRGNFVKSMQLSRPLLQTKGFTLIELLVVIVIIGVLSAIALPGYLNQAAKARGSEAKSSVGTINRSQQAYRLEKSSFAGTLTNLDVKLSGKFYSYNVGTATATDSSVQAVNLSTDLKSYSGAIAQVVAGGVDFFGQVVCESTSINGVIPTPVAPTSAGVAPANGSSCTNGTIVN